MMNRVRIRAPLRKRSWCGKTRNDKSVAASGRGRFFIDLLKSCLNKRVQDELKVSALIFPAHFLFVFNPYSARILRRKKHSVGGRKGKHMRNAYRKRS
ncbi:MAG TPA: hypothetical protein PKD52_06830 [Clostridiales bacterium]|nr:hypothetical protein [Clostridiales bacterium]